MPISKEIEKEKVIGIFPCKKKKNNNNSAANSAPFFNFFNWQPCKIIWSGAINCFCVRASLVIDVYMAIVRWPLWYIGTV